MLYMLFKIVLNTRLVDVHMYFDCFHVVIVLVDCSVRSRAAV